MRAVGLKISSPNAEVGALDMVGDGTSSESLVGGSLRDSVFQMPVPHGNELPATFDQEIELPIPGLVLAPQGDWSVAGLVGLDGPEGRGVPVGREDLRLMDTGTSFSQEVRRAGFGAGAVDTGVSCG